MMFFRRQLKPLPSPPVSIRTGQSLNDSARIADILARTIWGEARGESVSGKEAVANVILNRVRTAQRHGGQYWWGDAIDTVCLQAKQFSCWNETDPNYKALLAVDAHDPNFATCLRIARRAVQGTLNDNTAGADHYHADTILPKWALDRTPVAQIGNHIFYKLEG